MGADSELTQRGAKLETGAGGRVQDQARVRSNGAIEFYAIIKNTVLLLPFLHRKKVRKHVMELFVV